MELTREVVELIAGGIFNADFIDVRFVAKRLLEEMDKPKVWDNAPEWATKAILNWSAPTHYSGVYKEYKRNILEQK